MSAYVVYSEYGSYSDYQMNILAVSLTKEGAEAEVAKQKAANDRLTSILNEVSEMRTEVYKPYSCAQDTMKGLRFDSYEYKEASKRLIDIANECAAAMEEKLKEIAAKYDVRVEYLRYNVCNDTSFNYQEVEVV